MAGDKKGVSWLKSLLHTMRVNLALPEQEPQLHVTLTLKGEESGDK